MAHTTKLPDINLDSNLNPCSNRPSVSCRCPRTCLSPHHLKQQAYWEEKDLGAGILYIISLSRWPLAVSSFTLTLTHTYVSARLALLWSVIKYFSAGLWRPGECREMETNDACMDTGLKRQKWKEIKSLGNYVKWQSLLYYKTALFTISWLKWRYI